VGNVPCLCGLGWPEERPGSAYRRPLLPLSPLSLAWILLIVAAFCLDRASKGALGAARTPTSRIASDNCARFSLVASAAPPRFAKSATLRPPTRSLALVLVWSGLDESLASLCQALPTVTQHDVLAHHTYSHPDAGVETNIISP
jgi:hypothetical protein